MVTKKAKRRATTRAATRKTKKVAKKNKRGGAREGAGRKPVTTKTLAATTTTGVEAQLKSLIGEVRGIRKDLLALFGEKVGLKAGGKVTAPNTDPADDDEDEVDEEPEDQAAAPIVNIDTTRQGAVVAPA